MNDEDAIVERKPKPKSQKPPSGATRPATLTGWSSKGKAGVQ